MSSKRKHGVPTKDVRTTPEPDAEEEKFSGRNGDAQEDLSPGEEVGSLWPGYSGGKKMTPPATRELSSPLILQETSSIHDETSSSGNKEDEDDDDEDVDDLKTLPHDPERLKAFNMFVRLFVDENLDRIVPISKQPKEKIQAIIDSCTRQFPEFAERARKRIRTYLKSCRRNKRSRDPNTWPETTRPTPAHLTSVQAEQILAQACENESHNAKRMRLGLEPVSQPMPIIPGSEPVTTRATSMDQFSPVDSKLPTSVHNNNNNNNNNNIKSESPSISKTEHSISSHSGSPMNGSMTSSSSTNLYRPNFTQSFPRSATTHSPYPSTPIFGTPGYGTPNIMGNGPTDLSMKPTKPLLSHRLNPTEMAAVRQLITGYRESAAFLLRSADELEQLLLQQP
ncbi:nucleolar protein 4-like isoform X2 [Lycorma delicatula]|uniref:nucleolar protein 4-like isoform X2 n=1 Tax=Lycorma delicatula TaxID=130591 RepID=UPI003F516334